MAILALLCVFVIAPMGMAAAVLLREQLSRADERGRGTAAAAMLLGITFTVLEMVAASVVLVFTA